jgi:hypothetical protein
MNKRQEEKNNRLKNLSDSIVNCKLSVVGRAFSTRAGQLSLQVLVLGSVAIVLISGFVVWTDTYVKSVSRDVDKSQAFTIAEAGIEYYRWHLAHAAQDFRDGQATSTGPYIHPYYDKSNKKIGQFELVITAPASGSTIVAIQSTGKVDTDPTVSKIIKVKMGLPSFARYSVASNADIRFGAGTQVYGQLHSNGGIRFDGVAYNVVTSAKATYDDPDHGGGSEFGVHTHSGTTDPLPPTAVPVRNDVFKAGRQFPVPAVDFTGITADLAAMKAAAQTSSGYYKAASGSKGYEIVLKTNDVFDIYKVTALTSASNNCANNSSQTTGWGTWTVSNKSLVTANVPFPANGIIFIEDDLWISGQINTARLNIAAGRFPVNPSTYASITTNANLLYTNYDGQDVIGLIAQNDVNVGLGAADTLRVDAALIAQNGRVGRYHYASQCGTGYTRTQITSYGMIGTNQRYGWAYTDGTGYQTRIIIYDGNLLYAPPPNFPITASQYDIIGWEEVK